MAVKRIPPSVRPALRAIPGVLWLSLLFFLPLAAPAAGPAVARAGDSRATSTARGAPLLFPSLTVLPPGGSLSRVAARRGVSVGQLREWNPGLPSRPKPGAALRVFEPWDTPPRLPRLDIEIGRGPRGPRRVALTFDCGWVRKSQIEELTAVLKRHNAPATFFLTGIFLRENPEAVRRLAASGYRLGNHSWSHPHFGELDARAIHAELLSVENRVRELTGATTRPFWRPPFGDRDRRVLRAAAAAGYRSVYWTVDSLDWRADPPATADFVFDRVCRRPFEKNPGDRDPLDGAIILMHAAGAATPDALERIIPFLKEKGYRLVDLDEMLEP